MQRLELDFQRRKARWPLLGVVVLVAAISVTAATVHRYIDANDELMNAEGRVARLKRDLERQRLFDTDSRGAPVKDSAAAPQTRSPDDWETLFATFEAAADETITFLSFEPGPTEILLRAEAKDFEAMAGFINRLSNSTVLAEIRMTEQEIARDHPRRPLRVSVRANWKGVPR